MTNYMVEHEGFYPEYTQVCICIYIYIYILNKHNLDNLERREERGERREERGEERGERREERGEK